MNIVILLSYFKLKSTRNKDAVKTVKQNYTKCFTTNF